MAEKSDLGLKAEALVREIGEDAARVVARALVRMQAHQRIFFGEELQDLLNK